MQDVKMLMLIRKDLGYKRSELLSLVSSSTLKFITENNESNRQDELYVKLSLEEADWLKNGQKKIIAWAPNEDHLESIAFKADINGVPCHPIYDEQLKGSNGAPKSLTCLTLGPCDWNEISNIVGQLKLI
jgi:peptidyl-tRNA hydrolase